MGAGLRCSHEEADKEADKEADEETASVCASCARTPRTRGTLARERATVRTMIILSRKAAAEVLTALDAAVARYRVEVDRHYTDAPEWQRDDLAKSAAVDHLRGALTAIVEGPAMPARRRKVKP